MDKEFFQLNLSKHQHDYYKYEYHLKHEQTLLNQDCILMLINKWVVHN